MNIIYGPEDNMQDEKRKTRLLLRVSVDVSEQYEVESCKTHSDLQKVKTQIGTLVIRGKVDSVMQILPNV